jgi:predicted RND superfamily exporter protein
MEARRTMAHGFYSRLAEMVHRRRWTVLAIYGLLSVALGWVGSGIALKADLTDLLPRGTASGDDLRFFLERFGTTDALFFTLTAAQDDDVEALEEAAALLRRELEATGMFRSVRYGFAEEEGIEEELSAEASTTSSKSISGPS